MFIIKKYIGAYVSLSNQNNFETIYIDKIPIIKITPSLKTKQFMHGWYSDNSRIALEGAIQYYKPKIVFEFGLWFGKSTVGILQSSLKKLNYYGFDYFTPTTTNPKYVTMSPLDKIYIDHPRFETIISNVADYSKKHTIHFVVGEINNTLTIIPDLIYIDAIKNTEELKKFINKYLKINENIVIVGDDYIISDVREAVKNYKNKKIFGEHAYIITNLHIPDNFPKPVSDFSKYPKLQLSNSEINKIPHNMRYMLVE